MWNESGMTQAEIRYLMFILGNSTMHRAASRRSRNTRYLRPHDGSTRQSLTLSLSHGSIDTHMHFFQRILRPYEIYLIYPVYGTLKVSCFICRQSRSSIKIGLMPQDDAEYSLILAIKSIRAVFGNYVFGGNHNK